MLGHISGEKLSLGYVLRAFVVGWKNPEGTSGNCLIIELAG